MYAKNMNLIMENWRTFNNNKELMLLEVEFNKILQEEESILTDFHKLIEHYSSGGLLLEHNEALSLEKRLSKTRNAKAIQEIKKNPKILNEAGILTAASIPTAVGLIMRGVGLFLEKGVELYINKFANQELPEEYIARLSSQESVEMAEIDPTQVPSIAGAAGRGQSPDSSQLLQMVKDERKAGAYAEIRKYLNRKMPNESDKEYQARIAKSQGQNLADIAKNLSDKSPEMLRGKATLLKPQQKKVVLAILNLSQGIQDWGNYVQNFVKMIMKNVSKFIGKILNTVCRSEEEAAHKQSAVKKAFENLAMTLYCLLIAAGAVYLLIKAATWGLLNTIPKAYGASMMANITQSLDSAATAKTIKVELASNIKQTIADASDIALSGAKAEKTTHLKHYAHEIMQQIKLAGTSIITETFDLFVDCVGKPFGIKNAGEKAVGTIKNAWDKVKGWWNTPVSQSNNSPIKVSNGIKEKRIR